MSALEPANPHRVRVVGQRRADDPRPSRSVCRPCEWPIEWDPLVGRWTAGKVGVAGRSWECYALAGEDRYGEHEPGTAIVHPPAQAAGSVARG